MTPLLSLTATGFPARWLTWQEAIVDQRLGKFAYGFGDYEFTFRGGTNRYTGIQSRIELKSILVLKGRTPEACKHATVALTNEDYFDGIETCARTAGRLGLGASREITLSHCPEAGLDTWQNCCSCCTSCNAAKGSHTLGELGWELLYVPYAPSHQGTYSPEQADLGRSDGTAQGHVAKTLAFDIAIRWASRDKF